MIEERYIRHICSIDNHPISTLNIKLKEIYIKGLGACLYSLSNGSEITNLYYEVWANSITSNEDNKILYWGNNDTYVKKAMSLHRNGWRLISMKHTLLFDCYYILLSSIRKKDEIEMINKVLNYFNQNICGIFSKHASNAIFSYFANSIPNDNISQSLINHRKVNLDSESNICKNVLVVANVSAGKSTLINSMIGYRINKAKTTACTNKLVRIYNKTAKDGITLYNLNQTYEYTKDICSIDSDSFTCASLYFNSNLCDSNICFIDTPGINNSYDLRHRSITEDAIKNIPYDAVIYVSNARYFGTNDEYSILSYLKKHVKKTIIFVLNQLDCFDKEEDSITKMLKDYKDDLIKLGFKSPCIIPIMAYPALLLKLDKSIKNNIENKRTSLYKELLNDSYYDLPNYITGIKSDGLLEKTGINLLERQLINIIQS